MSPVCAVPLQRFAKGQRSPVKPADLGIALPRRTDSSKGQRPRRSPRRCVLTLYAASRFSKAKSNTAAVPGSISLLVGCRKCGPRPVWDGLGAIPGPAAWSVPPAGGRRRPMWVHARPWPTTAAEIAGTNGLELKVLSAPTVSSAWALIWACPRAPQLAAEVHPSHLPVIEGPAAAGVDRQGVNARFRGSTSRPVGLPDARM